MFGGNRILAFIPARGGSKGIKGKNIFPLCGKPLIAYTIETALECKYVDHVIVSTDSEKIAEVARNFGADVPFLRPSELAADTSKTIDAILYTLTKLKEVGKSFEDLVLLQPTSPLRSAEDVNLAIEKYFKFGRRSLISISKASESPMFMRQIIAEDKMEKLLDFNSTIRRQDMPDYYVLNGAIYINKVSDIDEQSSFNDNEVPFIMPCERSVDVDGYLDLEVAKYFIHKGKLY